VKGAALPMIGQTFGRLTVLERAPNLGQHSRYLCQCSCGNTHKVTGSNLRQGNVRSCGCKKKERKPQHEIRPAAGKCWVCGAEASDKRAKTCSYDCRVAYTRAKCSEWGRAYREKRIEAQRRRRMAEQGMLVPPVPDLPCGMTPEREALANAQLRGEA
jgi:hypothetical protein